MVKIVTKSENIKKSQKFSKNHFFFKNLKILKKKNLPKKCYSLSFSLRPELSSPAHFRIQGGYPERDTVGVAGQYFPFLI